jgi:hypothetical protein
MLYPRRPVWMMLLAPVVVMVLANVSAARRFSRGRRVSNPLEGAGDRVLARLRSEIVGNGKRRISSMLGPPRVQQTGTEGTWYYPVNPKDHLAIAISFDGGLARDVEYVWSPV